MAPNTLPWDMSHMYTLGDLRPTECPTLPNTVNSESILGFIRESGYFTLFDRIITLARMTDIYNQIQFRGTLFLPPDYELLKRYPLEFFNVMDPLKAIQICRRSTLDRIIPGSLLISTPQQQLVTRQPDRTMLLTRTIYSDDGKSSLTILGDGGVKILQFDLNKNNGVIHLVDNILS